MATRRKGETFAKKNEEVSSIEQQLIGLHCINTILPGGCWRSMSVLQHFEEYQKVQTLPFPSPSSFLIVVFLPFYVYHPFFSFFRCVRLSLPFPLISSSQLNVQARVKFVQAVAEAATRPQVSLLPQFSHSLFRFACVF